MSTVASAWHGVPPVRGGLSRIDVADPRVWDERLRHDRDRAERHQAPELAAITAIVEARSRERGALALVLSGSTARGRRTGVSDLDYHVIGSRPNVDELPSDIDLYSDDPDDFRAKLRSGDDFAHWSVWYGCVLFDSGVMEAGAAYVARHDAWPDPDRKLRQARHALDFAERIVESADYEPALEQVRGALSLTARWWLLAHDVFPLARDELSTQLMDLGNVDVAAALHASIHERPTLASLSAAAATARALTEAVTGIARVRRPSTA